MSTETMENLKAIQSATGWSQPRIAEELGISQPTVNRLLNGQPDCKASTSKAIAELHRRVCGRKTRASDRQTPP